jgi:RHS repeat-associated protein
VPNPFQYAGYYNDGTGLYHVGARYYDAAIGRFSQQDPSGQEANAYAYAGDSPVNATDPTGRGWREFLAREALKVVEKELRNGNIESLIGRVLDGPIRAWLEENGAQLAETSPAWSNSLTSARRP